jgi:hypothetical protein
MSHERGSRVYIRTTPEFKAALADEAKFRHLSITDLLQAAVGLYMEQVPRPERSPRFTDDQIAKGREEAKEWMLRLIK